MTLALPLVARRAMTLDTQPVAPRSVGLRALVWRLLRPLLGAGILALLLFAVHASAVVPGFSPDRVYACDGAMSSPDYWEPSSNSNIDYSATRTVKWVTTIVGSWCYTYRFASYTGGSSWLQFSGSSGTVATITVGADGNMSQWGYHPAFKSCTGVSGGQPSGTCGSAASGNFNNNLFIDTARPTVSITSPSNGSTLYYSTSYTFSGSWSDPSPSSGQKNSGWCNGTSTCTPSGASIQNSVTYTTPASGSTWYVCFVGQDNATWTSSTACNSYTLTSPDTTAPVATACSIYPSGSAIYASVSGYDAGGNGTYWEVYDATAGVYEVSWTLIASGAGSGSGGPVGWSASGSHTVYVYLKDGLGNTRTACSGTVSTDTTAPVTQSCSVSVSGLTISATYQGYDAGGNGTYWEVYDATAGVYDLGWTYIAAGGNSSGLQTTSWSLTAAPVSRTIYVYAKDGLGNSSTACSNTVTVTPTAPTVTVNVTGGTLGANGWYTATPTVSFTTSVGSGSVSSMSESWSGGWSGSVSGSCPNETLGAETTGETYTCSLTNSFGLSSNASKVVKLDTSAPVIVLSVSPSMPDGSNGWNVGPVSVSWSVTESVSTPVASALTGGRSDPASCSSSAVPDTTGTSYTCTATNAAGLTSSVTSASIKKDTTSPTVTPPSAPAPATGTSAGGAQVSFGSATGADPDGSSDQPVTSCTPSSSSLFFFGTTSVDCTATDRAGNVSHGSFSVLVNPGPPMLAPQSDTGRSNADSITDCNWLTVQPSCVGLIFINAPDTYAPPNASLTLWVNDSGTWTPIGGGVARPDGTWQIVTSVPIAPNQLSSVRLSAVVSHIGA